MGEPFSCVLHAIKDDGLPDMERMTGRVAFIWDGYLISGWPLYGVEGCEEYGKDAWEPADDRFGDTLVGVTHWVELPTAVWNLRKLTNGSPP